MPFVLPLLGAKEVNTSGKTFTVKSSLQLLVNRHDDGVAYTCRVDHVALTATHEDTTQVLEVQCEYKGPDSNQHPMMVKTVLLTINHKPKSTNVKQFEVF